MPDPVNLWSKEDTLRYARSLDVRYGVLVVYNGIRYQIKHEATRSILIKQGWEIVEYIPGRKQ